MEDALVHEIELYSPEAFKTILEHEVNRSHRYGDSLTLIDLIVEADPPDPQNQHSAEVFTINALNVHLRNTDIPCKKGNEFLLLMPATGTPGARTACERLKKLMTVNPQAYDRVSFKVVFYIGMATLPNDDRSVSSEKLTQYAAEALHHARTNHLTNAISFTEITK